MNNTSRKIKHKEPIRSSFPPPNLETTNAECTNRQLTPEELAEVIEKYGPPKMKLSAHRNHYMSSKKKKEKPA